MSPCCRPNTVCDKFVFTLYFIFDISVLMKIISYIEGPPGERGERGTRGVAGDVVRSSSPVSLCIYKTLVKRDINASINCFPGVVYVYATEDI